MKATVQSLSPPAVCAERGWVAVYADLIKARLTFLVLLTTLVGYYLGCRGPVDYWLMLHTLIGTGLVASGAAALNQLLEREYDAKMSRTMSRAMRWNWSAGIGFAVSLCKSAQLRCGESS